MMSYFYGGSGMMGSFGAGLLGSLWLLVWTANSVLIGILLVALIRKYWKR